MIRSELQMYGAETIRLLKQGETEGEAWLREYVISVLIEAIDTVPDAPPPPVLSASAIRHLVAFTVDSEDFATPEPLAIKLAQSLLERYPFLDRTTVDIQVSPWSGVNGCVFVPETTVAYLCTVEMTRDAYILESGIDEVRVARVGEIHSEGIHRDLFGRTDQTSNLWGAKLQVKWQYLEIPGEFEAIRGQVLEIIMTSLDVVPLPNPHRWANLAADMVLQEITSIERVTISAEVSDVLQVDVERYGKENRRTLFWNSDEAPGVFTVRLAR